MMLGKRPRPSIKRTTSMSGFSVDSSSVEAPLPTDVQNLIKDLQNPAGQEGTARRNIGVVGSDEFHSQLLATVSPSNHRRNSLDSVETAPFLRACSLCNRRLAPGRDIYMYRGDKAFCSLECRQQQMKQDERKEKCSMASKKESPTTTGSETSNKGETVAAA